MGSFLNFHVKTNDKKNLTLILKELSSTNVVTESTFPHYLYDDESSFAASEPRVLAIIQKPNGWISVYHNTFEKLSHWGELISKTLNTTFIQIIGQTTSDYYYFAMFEKGELRREIETDSMDCEVLCDKGSKFPFEKEPLLIFDDPDYFFDMDTIEKYCKHFDLDISLEFSGQYLILSKKSIDN